jgi:thioredoxin-related protein
MIRTLLILFFMGALVVSAADVRTWTSADGRKLEASFADVVRDAQGAAEAVKVRPPTGGELVIRLDQLSTADQEFVKAAMAQILQREREELLDGRRAKWTEDWEKAREESRSTGLPILLLMTGSDWCGYCVQLKANVFEERDFQRFADKNLVLMMADFPSASQKRSLKEQNAQLKDEFGVGGYPTVHLVKDGETVASLRGYGGDSAKEYVAKIEDRLQ